MAIKVFDYHCWNCEHIFEEFVKSSDEEVACENCGSYPCTRLTPTPPLSYSRMGVDPTMTTSADKWDRNREQEMKRERRLGISQEED